MRILRTILQSELFLKQPPVLIDIGASGEINAKWKEIAPYSVCIAFDADDREFKISEETNKGYKKLVTFNRIVSEHAARQQSFYLTASPFCSSLLKPDTGKLKNWAFADLFEVVKETTLPAITIEEALSQAGITYIDWFKSDTQGTDLRLFTSLPPRLAGGILALEFEPGIMDAYQGEDKLHAVMREMDKGNYWMSGMQVKGTQRIGAAYKNEAGKRALRNSPCWAEVTYLRQPSEEATQRQLLLLYAYALIEKQYGFAIEVADFGLRKFNEPIFTECRKAALDKLRQEKWKAPLVIVKRQINKMLARIHD
jgi:hypothetical protein